MIKTINEDRFQTIDPIIAVNDHRALLIDWPPIVLMSNFFFRFGLIISQKRNSIFKCTRFVSHFDQINV